MTGKMSLVEQKRLQWAKEREEMSRLCAPWGPPKPNDFVRNTIRTRMSCAEQRPLIRGGGTFSSTVSLKSLGAENPGGGMVRVQCLGYSGGSMVSLVDQSDASQFPRRRSPSLPPIYSKEQQNYLAEEELHQLEVEGLRYDPHVLNHRQEQKNARHPYGEDREGETSGYASDSAEAPMPVSGFLPGCKPPGTAMSENTWQNPKNYYATPESSLPPSRRLSAVKGGGEVRPRWGSLWGQEVMKGDPPPPSWLERGLSRLDHTSQVLVINHESASSPDSSTTGSAASDSNKTYLRGQNVPVDADVLQERETKRQKALELQNAVKQQLEERDRQRKEEKQRKIQEERAEEERIKRERDKEKQRFEEEQRRLKEKEGAKLKKEEAMRDVLEAAERLAKEEKKLRRKRCDKYDQPPKEKDININVYEPSPREENRSEPNIHEPSIYEETRSIPNSRNFDDLPIGSTAQLNQNEKEEKQMNNLRECNDSNKEKDNKNVQKNSTTIQVPVGKDVAIVLSGRLENPELLNASNLQVNLVVTPSPRNPKSEINTISALVQNLASPVSRCSHQSFSPRLLENRLLTPSKYRSSQGRDFGTQTDLEEFQVDVMSMKDVSAKECKEAVNANRRDVEKYVGPQRAQNRVSNFDQSTNTVFTEERSVKTMLRSKSQPRTTLESRPRWNANRPGTRYRTQSEKDPHYQRRLRLGRSQIESSDEDSRSPSLDRRKHNNSKSKGRNSVRRKVKLDSYDADLSMDSLNSVVPLRVDKNGRINIEGKKNNGRSKFQKNANNHDRSPTIEETSENLDPWCGREILSQLTTLRNGLIKKQKEWDPERCLMSPTSEFC